MRVYSQSQQKFIDQPEEGMEAGSLTNISPEMASLGQMLLSPTEARKMKAAFDIQQAALPQAADQKVLSGADATKAAQARSGLESVQSAKRVLFGDEGGERTKASGLMQLLGASTDLVPFGDYADLTPWGRGLESDLFNAVEVILRSRSGAAVPEDEVKRYVKAFGPKMTDSKKVKEKKLNKIGDELQEVLSLMGQDNDPLGLGI